MRKTFMDRAVADEFKGQDIQDAIDDEVAAWRKYESTIDPEEVGENIMTWLGMSWKEYSRWASWPGTLYEIIRERKKKEPINDPEEVSRIRSLLKQWDDGEIILGEFESLITRPFKNTLLKSIQDKQVYGEVKLGHFNHEENEKKTYNVNVIIFDGGFSFEPQ